jgi:hypothetical protein
MMGDNTGSLKHRFLDPGYRIPALETRFSKTPVLGSRFLKPRLPGLLALEIPALGYWDTQTPGSLDTWTLDVPASGLRIPEQSEPGLGAGTRMLKPGITCSEPGITCSEPGITCSVPGLALRALDSPDTRTRNTEQPGLWIIDQSLRLKTTSLTTWNRSIDAWATNSRPETPWASVYNRNESLEPALTTWNRR